jgi:hypothetical protein
MFHWQLEGTGFEVPDDHSMLVPSVTIPSFSLSMAPPGRAGTEYGHRAVPAVVQGRTLIFLAHTV